MTYAELCRKFEPTYDPRHIEAYMRIEHGTLDHLDRASFKESAHTAALCVDSVGSDEADELARSYGL